MPTHASRPTGERPQVAFDAATAQALQQVLRRAAEMFEAPLAVLALRGGVRCWWPASCATGGSDAELIEALLARARANARVDEGAGPFFHGAALDGGGSGVHGAEADADVEGASLLAICDPARAQRTLDAAQRFALATLAGQAAVCLRQAHGPEPASALGSAHESPHELAQELARARQRADAFEGAATALAAAPIGLGYAGRGGCIVTCNGELVRLWGPFPSPLAADTDGAWPAWWADQSSRHGEAVAPHERALVRALRGERVDGDVLEIEPAGGGLRRSVIVRAAPLRDAAGAPAGAVIAVSETSRQSEVKGATRRNEERFRALVHNSAQIVWVCDRFGHPALDSPSWRAFTGQSVEEAAGAGWLDAVHPDDRPRLAAIWDACTRTPAPYEAEYRVRNAAGEYRWTVARGQPIVGADGAVREWVGTNSDIHDRRMAEEASREWRRRLETILEAGDIGTWSWDLASDRLVADANVARLYGIDPDVARAGTPMGDFLQVVHPDDLASVQASLEAALARGEPHQVVHRVRHADGLEPTVNVRGQVEYDAAGVAVRLSGVVLDVTRQVEIERALQSSESARLQGEQRYRTVLNAVDVGFCMIEMIFDEHGEPVDYLILETNPAFAQHTGLVNAAGKRMRELVPGHDVRWSRIFGRVARIGLPVRVEQYAGNLGRWLDAYAARIGDPARFHVAVFLRDVTEERQRNDTLQRLADDLADANRRQSEFLATLAHELRNPLAPVRTGLDLLRIGADKPSVLAKVRPMMERQVNHLVHLVDDLLDLARINSGKIELKKTDVVLKDVVLRAVEMTLPAIEAKRHDFQLALLDGDTRLHADPTRLAQVIGNLLTNAAKYTIEGGAIRLEAKRVAAAGGGDLVRISVTDSGIGIPAESLPRIFDMFTQVGRHPEQEAGGLGIGLHLVRQMTERHGGKVYAESEGPGRGSRFVVELPVAPRARAGETALDGAPAATGTRALRILLADDNADAVELLREVLQMEGHTVHTAGNGLAALEAASTFAPDIAFLDIGMPGLNGYEVARRMRALPGGSAPTLVAVTGWGTEEDRVKSGAAGFDHHLTKPVDLGSLMALIRANR